ncbi:ArsR/SmtB family transcription factor [Halococcus hamelinensis]|jgi:predicted ArsR family transcriptional regulator|uniref:Transcriptional regulator, arsr family protein n=1 Tax=Halococcus hamelinensis 100A6 TaxID=1132509 RepID=M0M095_9EURY|nr:winged helix-turn-helix domain-containing protein [Halococcus hamelinensis]EMA37805.1 transcriptional regulator, arsr family protein [Halococcus hamelinensis 100A6]
MEAVLWYVFIGTRGGENRARLLRALANRPRNPNQLADDLDLDYTTIRHHLDVLVENDVLRNSGDEYGAIYLPTDRARANWETVERIIEQVE